MAIVLDMQQQTADDDEGVACTSCERDQPDGYPQYDAVQEVDQAGYTVAQRVTDSHHRRVAALLEQTERPADRYS